MELRSQLFDRQVLKSHRLPVPVVSIGNLTVGGTGKSPMTMALLEWAASQNISLGVISRGYGRQTKGVLPVDHLVSGAPKIFGDEPVMLKTRFPKVPVVVGEKRFQAGQAILKSNSLDGLLADDAFQHRTLHRDVDIVLLDAMRPDSDYGVLPFGRGRESFSALKRCHFVILTKANFASAARLSELRHRILSVAPKVIIIEARYEFSKCEDLEGKALQSGKNVMLVAGLARPESFRDMIKKKFNVAGEMFFKDHHDYTASAFDSIKAEGQRLGVDSIVITEKDMVKFSAAQFDPMKLYVCRLKLEFSQEYEQLKEHLRELFK